VSGSDANLRVPLACPVPQGADVACVELSFSDGYRTSVLRWKGSPGHTPVLMVHGIQSHLGWFIGSAAAMWRAGHTVYQLTRRGSGSNALSRGHARSAAQLLDDLAVAHRRILTDTGASRCHLVGVSWGGKLLAAYAAKQPPAGPIASLALLSPGIVPQVDMPIAVKLAIAGCLLIAPHKLFDIPLSDVDLFTDNEAMRRYLRDDACRLHRATARFLYATRQLDRMLKRAPDGAIDVRTALILAERDRIINNAATANEVSRLTAGRAALVQLPGSHTLDFEPDPAPFHSALCAALARAD